MVAVLLVEKIVVVVCSVHMRACVRACFVRVRVRVLCVCAFGRAGVCDGPEAGVEERVPMLQRTNIGVRVRV